MKIWFLTIEEKELLYFFKEQQIKIETIEPMKEQFREDNMICFLIHGQVAGFAKIEKVELFSVTLQFQSVIGKENRTPFAREFHEVLVKEWGFEINEKIRHYTLLSEKASAAIATLIKEMNNDFSYYMVELDYLIEQEERKEQNKLKKEKHKKDEKKEIDLSTYSAHTKAQYHLKELASIVGLNCWMASNDKNREFKGEKLGDACMGAIPDFPLKKEAKKGIGLIDTIWFKESAPKCAFEVECTTSVYSGLLRFADMISVMPTHDMKFYIVAPRERKNKVMKELNRPIFKVIGMDRYCKYIAMEELELLYMKVKGLNGYIKEDVLESIAYSSEMFLKEKELVE